MLLVNATKKPNSSLMRIPWVLRIRCLLSNLGGLKTNQILRDQIALKQRSFLKLCILNKS